VDLPFIENRDVIVQLSAFLI